VTRKEVSFVSEGGPQLKNHPSTFLQLHAAHAGKKAKTPDMKRILRSPSLFSVSAVHKKCP